jgi:flagellar motor switch protein FliM
LALQGAVGIYTMAPLKSGCLVHFDTRLAFSLLELMLGASPSGESPTLERHLTTIEMSILKTTMTMLAGELERALRPVAALQVSLARVENNFRMVSIVEPEAEVLVCRFALRLGGEEAGCLRCIVPYLSLEPLRDKFRGLVRVAQATTRGWARQFARELLTMECAVAARSGLIPMTIRRLLALRAGEVIDLPYNPDQPLTVLVEDRPLFTAIAGERDGRRAFHVTMAQPDPTGPSSAHTLDPAETAELLRGEPDRSDNGADGLVRDLEFLYDVPLQVSVEVGRARILLKDLLQMGEGSVVELDKMAGEPLDLYVNSRLIARGEAVRVGDKFGIRLTEVVSQSDRLEKLG